MVAMVRGKTVAGSSFFLYSCSNSILVTLLSGGLVQSGVDWFLPFEVSASSSNGWQDLDSLLLYVVEFMETIKGKIVPFVVELSFMM